MGGLRRKEKEKESYHFSFLFSPLDLISPRESLALAARIFTANITIIAGSWMSLFLKRLFSRRKKYQLSFSFFRKK